MVRVTLRNPSRTAVSAAVSAALPNFIGADGFALKLDEFRGRLEPTGAKAGSNTYQESKKLRGLSMTSNGVARDADTWGSLALTTTARKGVTHRTTWNEAGWSDALLDFWDDFSADGHWSIFQIALRARQKCWHRRFWYRSI